MNFFIQIYGNYYGKGRGEQGFDNSKRDTNFVEEEDGNQNNARARINTRMDQDKKVPPVRSDPILYSNLRKKDF